MAQAREAMTEAVLHFDETVGRSAEWKRASGCKDNAFGLVSCGRFVTASGNKSPFRSSEYLGGLVRAEMRLLSRCAAVSRAAPAPPPWNAPLCA